jgi:FHS family L-fucose permease-like MFS transporter
MTGFETNHQKNHTPTFVILSTLFLMWGLITVISGFLVAHLTLAFQLDYSQAMVISMAFFTTYFFISFPAGKLIDKVGFKNGIITGIIVTAIGCLLFYLAADRISYGLSVLSLFVLASGITVLQVGANPYVVLVGMRGRGAQRLTFVQGFNSLGTFLAAIFAGKVVSGVDQNLDPEGYKIASAQLIQSPYLIMGLILLGLALIVAFSDMPKIQTRGTEPLIKEKIPPRRIVFEFPHVALGCIAIFAYVGAEVTIFQFLLSRMNSSTISQAQASEIDSMITVFWGGLMVGRFLGAAILAKISPRKLMLGSSLIAALLVAIFILSIPKDLNADWTGSLWILTLTGLFNSVLFPCIFTMGMDGLGKFSEEGSSVLIMSIVGGAVIPFAFFNTMGQTSASIMGAFVIILVCYLFIAFFGIRGSRYEKRTNFY